MIIASVTGMFGMYSVPTASNEPNIKKGSKIYVSNLKDPAMYNFVVYNSEYADSMNMIEVSDTKKASKYFHRLCGLPGNTVEMKNGILYVNNKDFDKKLDLNQQYIITNAGVAFIKESDLESLYESGGLIEVNNDSALVILDRALLEKYASEIKPVLYITHQFEFGAFKWNNKDKEWTADNFGPLTIPAGCYFVLGDNRHNALDSRYIGFVKKENIKGVVLNK